MSNENCKNINSCDFCYFCNSCDFCYFCNSCDFCYGLRMSERMIFCLGEGKYESKGIGYQKNLMMFNKSITKDEYDTQIKYIKAKNFKLPIAKWVEYKDLSKDEQTTTAKQLGRLLKTLSYKDASKQMWSEMKSKDKNFFKTLLNFDADIFEKITGIKIDDEVSLKGKEVEVKLDGKVYKAIIQ